MPRFFFVAFFYLLFLSNLKGQVYHYETGKILPVSEPNQIIWKQGVFNNYPADYGTLVTKENQTDRTSRLINIPVIRVKASQPNLVLAPIFILNGGPGESNFQNQLLFDELTLNHDVVFVGYRGVDGSVKLDCPCMKNALLNKTLTLDNYENRFKQAIDSCLLNWRNQKIDIKGYTMDEVVNDIETTRQILGYDSINFVAFSYGTMLSQLYQLKYGKHVKKMALIGARPLNNFVFESLTYNTQFGDFLAHSTGFEKLKALQISDSTADNLIFRLAEKNTHLNPYRFVFFSFSKLYSLGELEKLLIAYNNALANMPETLTALYTEFYRTFPGSLVIGDIILKKQGRVNFDNLDSDTSSLKVAHIVNAWYSPKIKLLKAASTPSKSSDTTAVKVLFVSGQFDVAAPPCYLTDTLNFNYPDAQKTILPNIGHTDLFNAKLDSVKRVMVEFFK